MGHSSKLAVVTLAVFLQVTPSFAAAAPRIPKKVNPIVALLRQFAARAFDGGDMSYPRP